MSAYPKTPDKAVFTIATGKKVYLEMACALVRSFRIWNDINDIPFFLATDTCKNQLPEDLKDIPVITLVQGQFGQGFAPKLNLDKIAPAFHSLFIDADSLCVGSIEKAFDVFKNHSVSVIGKKITSGNWSCNVKEICRKYKIKSLIRFNGGVYYLEKNSKAYAIYETARKLEPEYDKIGFERLRNCPNDELLMSLAMSLHNQKPVSEKNGIMNSILAGAAGININVQKGYAFLKNDYKNPWYKQDIYTPKIVHFCGIDTNSTQYAREILKLKLMYERNFPEVLANACISLLLTLPSKIKNKLKDILRPAYHNLFGKRAIKSNRHFE